MKITFRPNRQTPAKWMLDVGLVAGKRRQLFFKTEAEAKAALKLQAKDRRDVGNNWAELAANDRRQFAEILDEITAAGFTLPHVWTEFKKHNATLPTFRVTLADAIAKTIASKRELNRRPAYITHLAAKLANFAAGRESQFIDSVTQLDVKNWLTLRGTAPMSYRSNLGRIKVLFTYAKTSGWTNTNPTLGIEKPAYEPGPPVILTNDQARTALEYIRAEQPHLLAYFTLALFAGIRPAEGSRLTWADIDLAEKHVSINASVAKTRERRISTLHPTAVAWLKVCQQPAPGTPIAPARVYDELGGLKAKLGFTKWPGDVLRHTAATHLLRHYGSAERTAEELGHSPEILYKHYRAIVSPQISQQFWDILPDQGKIAAILSMQAQV